MKKLVLLTLCIILSSTCFAPKNPFRIIFLHKAYQQYVQIEETEKRVSLILKTIRVVESGGSYTIGGDTGETGAYQFMPATWRYYSLLFFNEILDISNPFNQDRVARAKVTMLVKKGYSNAEIASVWNCGSRYYKGKIGINWKGIPYNVPRHVNRFLKIYNKLENKKYIQIDMRNRKALLMDYNEQLEIQNTAEWWFTKTSIEKVDAKIYGPYHSRFSQKDWEEYLQKMNRVGVSAKEASIELRKALLSIPPQIPRHKQFINYLKSLNLRS